MKVKRIAITGGNGQLAKAFQFLLKKDEQFIFKCFAKEDWDILDLKISEKILEEFKPDFLINTAAYTAVDKAEDEWRIVSEINTLAPSQLAQICHKKGIKLIHFSTDYVFDGKSDREYLETDPTQPLNFYGISKSESDKVIVAIAPESIIIRVSWLYFNLGKNFVNTMLKIGIEQENIQVVNDQVSSPTYALFLAEDILSSIRRGIDLKGIYHYSLSEECSWMDFANEIFSFSNTSCIAQPISTQDYGAKAIRPLYSKLNASKFFTETGIKQRSWKDGLQSFFQNQQYEFNSEQINS